MDAFWWILFVVLTLQPVITQKMLEWARLRRIASMERSRRSRVITLIHRQETMGFLGFPIYRYIDIDDSEAILRAIKLTDADMPIDLVLHTPGGLVLAAEQIAHAVQRHKAKVTVFVPHYAMSGGTLIALAADEIVMDENAVLGPVDPQLGDRPAASLLSVLKLKPMSEIDDNTIVLADVAEKAIWQVKTVVTGLLKEHMSEQSAGQVAEILSTGTWTHDFPILVEQARALGLTVGTQMPEEVYELMNLYPQTRQRRPSVEYIPSPHGGLPTAPKPPPRQAPNSR
jgi:ClpP class serine protease